MKLTNKQLRQIIKEELEYVMGEGFTVGFEGHGREIPFELLQSMPYLHDLAKGDDMRYHLKTRYSGGEEEGTVFVKKDGKVFASKQMPLALAKQEIQDLEAKGYKQEFFGGETNEPPGSFHGGSGSDSY
jgi:hypothetical protein